jgi:tetraacyldisaccharide 4'-kinase
LPLSWIYGSVMFGRNLLYNWGIFGTYLIPKKSICVGNLSVGGTGKTPHVAYLAELLKDNHKISILSRGYGRSTKGYLLASKDSTAKEIGDEPRLYTRRFFPQVQVIVCEKRALGVKKIQSTFPQNEVILLDDAFQHRAVKAGKNLLLTDYHRLFTEDYVLPAGNLREWKQGVKRADWVIVTKSPEDLSPESKRQIAKKIRINPDNLFFSSLRYGALLPFGKKPEHELKNLLVVTGIANPSPLIEWLKKKYTLEIVSFSDHHNFTKAEIKEIHQKFDTFAQDRKAIVTTEKDFMRLSELLENTRMKNYPWMYQPISVKIDKEEIFNTKITQYVNTI